MVGPGKNCKRIVFWTMLFLKVSKTIIQESRKIKSWEIWVISMLLGWVHRYVCHCQKFYCNYFPLCHINGTGLLDYLWHMVIPRDKTMSFSIICHQKTMTNNPMDEVLTGLPLGLIGQAWLTSPECSRIIFLSRIGKYFEFARTRTRTLQIDPGDVKYAPPSNI